MSDDPIDEVDEFGEGDEDCCIECGEFVDDCICTEEEDDGA